MTNQTLIVKTYQRDEQTSAISNYPLFGFETATGKLVEFSTDVYETLEFTTGNRNNLIHDVSSAADGFMFSAGVDFFSFDGEKFVTITHEDSPIIYGTQSGPMFDLGGSDGFFSAQTTLVTTDTTRHQDLPGWGLFQSNGTNKFELVLNEPIGTVHQTKSKLVVSTSEFVHDTFHQYDFDLRIFEVDKFGNAQQLLKVGPELTSGIRISGAFDFKGETYFYGHLPDVNGERLNADIYFFDDDKNELVKTGIVEDDFFNFLGTVMVPEGDYFYFWQNTEQFGGELFKSDGTAAGTVLVKDFYPNDTSRTSSPYPGEFATLGDKIVFVTNSEQNGRVLFVSDGTAAGTFELSGNGTPVGWLGEVDQFTSLGDKVVFTANRELYVTDGTLNGTKLLRDFLPDSARGSQPNNFVEVDGLVYFFNTRYDNPNSLHATSQGELWVTDGTEAGTQLVAKMPENVWIQGFDVVNSFDTANFADVNPVGGSQIVGTDDADVLSLTGLSDNVDSGAGNDKITGAGGNDTIDGGAGTDTAIYAGDAKQFSITINKTGAVNVQDRSGTEGTDSLTSIEKIDFQTGAKDVSLDVLSGVVNVSSTDLKAFIEIYIAYFNRAPDAEGLFYWGTRLSEGMSKNQIAESFYVQPETKALYTNPDDTEGFVTAVYQNFLGRAPDTDGFNYWVKQLDDGVVSKPIFLLAIINGAKATTGSQTDVDYFTNKANIGAYYSVIKGMSNVDNGKAAMALYDGSAGSITAAKNAIDGYYTAALDANNGELLINLVGVMDDPFAA